MMDIPRIDTELSSYESCVTLFPFFSVNNLEFNYLCGTDSSNGVISYDKYFSPSKLSEITTNLNQQDFLLSISMLEAFQKTKTKLKTFL